MLTVPRDPRSMAKCAAVSLSGASTIVTKSQAPSVAYWLRTLQPNSSISLWIYHPRAAAARPRTHKEFINPGDLVKFIYFLCARRQGPSWLRRTDRPLVGHSDHQALVHVSGSEFLKLMTKAPRGQISHHA